jgi:hypothetical protein
LTFLQYIFIELCAFLFNKTSLCWPLEISVILTFFAEVSPRFEKPTSFREIILVRWDDTSKWQTHFIIDTYFVHIKIVCTITMFKTIEIRQPLICIATYSLLVQDTTIKMNGTRGIIAILSYNRVAKVWNATSLNERVSNIFSHKYFEWVDRPSKL